MAPPDGFLTVWLHHPSPGRAEGGPKDPGRNLGGAGPAHQSPTGVVLTPERRHAVLTWARDRDATIIEDDYDAEFRYDREPVGTLQGLSYDDPRPGRLRHGTDATAPPDRRGNDARLRAGVVTQGRVVGRGCG